jgi:hypothetical protein
MNKYFFDMTISISLILLLLSTSACVHNPIPEKKPDLSQSTYTSQATSKTAADAFQRPDNLSSLLPIEWSSYSINTDETYSTSAFYANKFRLEYPRIFKIANTAVFPGIIFFWWPNNVSDPLGEIRVSCLTTDWGSTIEEIIHSFGDAAIRYEMTETPATIDGIPAKLVSYYHHSVGNQGEIVSYTLWKYVVFEHNHIFWQVLITWSDKENVPPPEIDAYFQHVVETFHFLN